MRVLDQSELEQGLGGPPTPAPQPAPAPEPARGGGPSVTIPHVRGVDSPKGTPDRIPPRVRTPVAITVSGVQASAPVTLSIDGSGGGNGTAKINGKDTVELAASEEVNVRGDEQTERGKAGKLTLAARQGTTVLATSAPFSVAAWPTAIGFKFYSLMIALPYKGQPYWGARYEITDPGFEHTPDSDSGVHGDLDLTKISENVVVDSATGIYRGAENRHSEFQRTTAQQRDRHGTGAADAAALIARIGKAGGRSKQVSHQFFRFSCARSGVPEDLAAAPKVAVSGAKITHTTSKSDGKNFVDVSKVGFENNGIAAAAVDDPAEKHAEIKD